MNKKPVFYPVNLDKRIIEKRIRTGEITEDDLKEYLNSLTDVASNAEDLTVMLEETT